MKTIVVLVRKDRVKREVSAEVAYLGAKQSGMGTDVYGTVRLVKEDDDWLEASFGRALTALFSQLSPWLKDFLPSEDMLLSVPLNFDMAQHVVLRELVNEYLKNMLVSEWMALHPGQEGTVKKYDDLATSQIELIRQALNKRVRPKQPLYDEDHKTIARRKRPEQ